MLRVAVPTCMHIATLGVHYNAPPIDYSMHACTQSACGAATLAAGICVLTATARAGIEHPTTKASSYYHP